MGIGNTNTDGNKKSNFNWQLRVLQLLANQEVTLQAILAALGGVATTSTSFGPFTYTGVGSIPANSKSYAIANIGSADGDVGSNPLPPNFEISFAAQDGETFPAVIPYDATGTTFLITYIL